MVFFCPSYSAISSMLSRENLPRSTWPFCAFPSSTPFLHGQGYVAFQLPVSLMFGVAHLYQGKGGSLGTGILGVLFASVRVAYRSIFPVVIWHAVLDVVAGIAGARYFGKQATPEADLHGLQE